MQVLTFQLGGRTYALPLERVREVVRAVAIRSLPGAPEIVEGLIGLRSLHVPVLDMRARFGHPRRPVHPDEQMVVAVAGGRPVAFRVDRTLGLEDVKPDAIGAGPGWEGGASYVAGVTRLEDDLVLIHDLDTFLSSSEAVALDAAVEKRG